MSSSDLDKDRDDLAWRIKATAGSRFNAAERLRSRDKRINILNALASALVIFLSVVPLAVRANERFSILVALVTVLASIMILVTALLQYASADALTAENLYSSGVEMNALRRKLIYRELHDRETLVAIAGDYDAILGRYPNHDSADYERYRQEHPDEFKEVLKRGTGPGGFWLERLKSQIPLMAGFVLTLITLSLIAIAIFGHNDGITVYW